MLKLEGPLEMQIKQFWDWWTGELLSMVPENLRKILGAGTEYLILTVDDHGVGLVHFKDGAEVPLVHFLHHEAGDEPKSQFLKDHPHLLDLKIVLRLLPAQGLRKQIKLPMAAIENLGQVVSFEMDRLTPFKNDQVYFSTFIVNRFKATRQLLVELILTPRAKLDALLSQLAGSGWQPETVYLTGDFKPGQYNLLPAKFKPAKNPLPDYINLGLGIATLALLLLLIILPIWSARAESLRLKSEVSATTKIAREVQSMQEESEKLLHQARFLQDKKHTEPVLVDALEELSRVIPDGTWLNGLQFNNRRIIIQGQSPSASSLIQRIEASAFFQNVSFVSPVTKDTANGLERFQIAADAANGRFSEKSH